MPTDKELQAFIGRTVEIFGSNIDVLEARLRELNLSSAGLGSHARKGHLILLPKKTDPKRAVLELLYEEFSDSMNTSDPINNRADIITLCYTAYLFAKFFHDAYIISNAAMKLKPEVKPTKLGDEEKEHEPKKGADQTKEPTKLDEEKESKSKRDADQAKFTENMESIKKATKGKMFYDKLVRSCFIGTILLGTLALFTLFTPLLSTLLTHSATHTVLAASALLAATTISFALVSEPMRQAFKMGFNLTQSLWQKAKWGGKDHSKTADETPIGRDQAAKASEPIGDITKNPEKTRKFSDRFSRKSFSEFLHKFLGKPSSVESSREDKQQRSK